MNIRKFKIQLILVLDLETFHSALISQVTTKFAEHLKKSYFIDVFGRKGGVDKHRGLPHECQGLVVDWTTATLDYRSTATRHAGNEFSNILKIQCLPMNLDEFE